MRLMACRALSSSPKRGFNIRLMTWRALSMSPYGEAVTWLMNAEQRVRSSYNRPSRHPTHSEPLLLEFNGIP
jgi:hypothetical protein